MRNFKNSIDNLIHNPRARRTAIATSIVAATTVTGAATNYLKNQFSRVMNYINNPAPIEQAATTNELERIGYTVPTTAQLSVENYKTLPGEPSASGTGPNPNDNIPDETTKLLEARAQVKIAAENIQGTLSEEEWLGKILVGENTANDDETWFGVSQTGSKNYGPEDTPDLGTPSGIDIWQETLDGEFVMINRYGTNDLRSFTVYIDQNGSPTNLYSEISNLPSGQWAMQRYSDDLATTKIGKPILVQNDETYDIGTDTLALKFEEVPVARIQNDEVTTSYQGPADVRMNTKTNLTDAAWTDEGPMTPLGSGQYKFLLSGEKIKFFQPVANQK